MIDESIYPIVRNYKSAKDVWDKLSDTFEDKDLSRRLSLLRKLFRITLSDYTSLNEYLNDILSLAQKLESINAGLEDEFIGVIMLSGLTEEFDPMIMALENSGGRLTSDYVCCALMKQDMKLEDKTREKALFLKHPKKNKNDVTIVCFKCKKKRHKSYQCPLQKQQKDSTGNGKCSSGKSKHSVQAVRNQTLVAALSTETIKSNEWIIDSGASAHMSPRDDWLVDKKADNKEVVTANNHKIPSKLLGNVELNLNFDGVDTDVVISDVLYVPDLSSNLLSVNKLVDRGFITLFSRDGCAVYRENDCDINGSIVFSGYRTNGLFKLKEVEQHSANMTSTKNSRRLWHRRLGHLCRTGMNLLNSGLCTGMNFTGSSVDEPCIACVLGKQTRLKFNTSKSRTTRRLELVHSDLCGPMSEPSWGGAWYVLTFTDDFSRKSFVFLLRSKAEVVDKFKEFKQYVENEVSDTIEVLRTDNGKEYVCSKLEELLKRNGIRHELSVTYTPEQNGVAERVNRTLVEKARCMLQDAGLSKKYWGEAISTAAYLKNRSLTKVVYGRTPEEAWTGKKVDLSHLRVFGCKAFALTPRVKRKKLDPKSKEYIFVRYA